MKLGILRGLDGVAYKLKPSPITNLVVVTTSPRYSRTSLTLAYSFLTVTYLMHPFFILMAYDPRSHFLYKLPTFLYSMYSLFRKSTKATHTLLRISSHPYLVPTLSDPYWRSFQNPVTLRVRGCNARMLKPSHISLGSLDQAETSVSSVDLSICTCLNSNMCSVTHDMWGW